MFWKKNGYGNPTVEYTDGPKTVAARKAGEHLKRTHKEEPLSAGTMPAGIYSRRQDAFSALKEKTSLRAPKLGFLMKLLQVIIKDYKMLIRSRTSALIFFFGPLFIIFLVCLGFNTSTLHDINIAAFSEEYSPLSESLLSNLSDENYKIHKLNSQEECINAVRLNEYHVCVVFPKSMVQDNSANNVLTIYTDESRINIANALTDKLASKVSTQAKELSSGVVSQILGAVDSINREVEVGKVSITNLANHNKAGQTGMQSLLGLIDEFDFSYAELDTSAVSRESSEICSDYNISSCSSAFAKLNAEVEAIKANYNSLGTKLDTAKNKAALVQEAGQNIKKSLSEEHSKISVVEASFSNIKSSISAIKITNVENIVNPLKMSVQPVTKNRSYLVYLLPPLLVILIMFVSILTSATSVIREKQSSAYFRNFITPTNDAIFMLGQYITIISLVMLQVIIMLGVIAAFVPGISFGLYMWSALSLLIISTVFICVGMFLGYFYSTSESATVAATSIGALLLLFSNTVMPLETVSGFMRTVVQYNPFVIGEGILKQLLVFESVAAGKLYALLIIAGITIVLAFGVHKVKDHLLTK